METKLAIYGNKATIKAIENGIQVGELNFLIAQKVAIITHTYTFKGHEGRGIAMNLTLAAIKYAEKQGMKIRPNCKYAYNFLMKHTEFAYLLDEKIDVGLSSVL